MNRAGPGGAQAAAEVADGGGAAVDGPDLGADGLGDELDELLAALLAGHDVLAVLAVGGVGVATEDAAAAPTPSAAAPAAALLRRRGQVEARRVREVGDAHFHVVDRVDPRGDLLVRQPAGGALDDAFVDVPGQHVGAAGFGDQQVEHLAQRDGAQADV